MMAVVGIGKIIFSERRNVRGYCMYDGGKSAFETSITTAILPAWFAYLFLEANGISVSTMFGEMTSDTFWAWSVAGGALLVAIVSPAFGVIADRTKIKMKMLRILTYLGAGATLSLALAPLFPRFSRWQRFHSGPRVGLSCHGFVAGLPAVTSAYLHTVNR
mgnify:CR=1 FL=1